MAPDLAARAATPSLFDVLATVRSRRVGRGYRVDSGTADPHPVTGRVLTQADGPQRFVSARAPVALSEEEEALLAWAALGPNGVVAWEASMSGGFSQLVGWRGRTAPEANNLGATELLLVNDRGVFLYRPRPDPLPVSLEGAVDVAAHALACYRDGLVQVLEGRPDLDHGLRREGAPEVPLLGTHQHNLNRPGSTWLLPVTDAGRLLSGMVDLFAGKRTYLVDEFAGGRVAGADAQVAAGHLVRPLPISVYEQTVLRTSTYPAGCTVQNTRLAAEALGLGAWCLSGYDQDVVLGTAPEVTRGLGFTAGPANPRAPLPGGRRHTHGIPGVLATTCVPSPRYPTPEALVDHWYAERYGPGGWGNPATSPLAEGRGPWPADKAGAIITHPRARPPEWAWAATLATVRYCVDTFGQFPVTFDPALAGFGTVVHHLDTDYYDQHLRPGFVTDRIRHHDDRWHPTR